MGLDADKDGRPIAARIRHRIIIGLDRQSDMTHSLSIRSPRHYRYLNHNYKLQKVDGLPVSFPLKHARF
jgi:hypothetical protein